MPRRAVAVRRRSSAQLAQIAAKVADIHTRQIGLVHAAVVSLAGQVAALQAIIVKGGPGTLTPEQVITAAEEGARRVLDQLAYRT
jgi:hypothetical protein